MWTSVWCFPTARTPTRFSARSDPASPSAVCQREKGEAREAFEARMLEVLRAHDVEMLILAGFMAILSKEFVQNYPTASSTSTRR